jgi:hypothetical protein
MTHDQILLLEKLKAALYKTTEKVVLDYGTIHETIHILRELIHENSVLKREVEDLSDKIENQ